MSRQLGSTYILFGVILFCFAFYYIFTSSGGDSSYAVSSRIGSIEEKRRGFFSPYMWSVARYIDPPNERERVSVAVVVIVKDRKNEADYRIALNSVRCYAQVQQYDFIYVDYSVNETLKKMCPQPDFFFTRHCLMIDVMRRSSNEFFLFLDADIGVIHPKRRIEEFLPASSSVNVLFYNRFYNDEIMAGSYIVRKSKQAEDFLGLWVEYYERTKTMKMSGTDNGVIHSVVLEFFASEFNDHREVCEKTWREATNYNGLFKYEACIQYLISLISREEWAERGFYLYDKAQGWARDGWISNTKWCPRDLFFHGWKKQKLGGEWSLPFTAENIFDENCAVGEFDRWKYDPKFAASCLEVDLLLEQGFAERRKDFYSRLLELFRGGLFPAKAYEQFGMR